MLFRKSFYKLKININDIFEVHYWHIIFERPMPITEYVSLLIVEDDHESNMNLQTLFRDKFDDVIGAYDGIEGWKAFQSYRPNVIIVDIEMPGINGLDLVRYIRKIDQNCFVAVLTSYSNQEYLLKAVSLKLDAYLLKPITSSKLELLLNNIYTSRIHLLQHKIPLSDNTYYDSKAKMVIHLGNRIHLSHVEITILELLLYHKEEVVLHQTIENAFCDSTEKSRNAIKIIISHLRKKIPDLLIRSIPRIGYTLS